MTANKKKIFITETLSQPGRAVLNARDDIETVEFPNLISARDFEALLVEHAPVHGVALGATPVRRTGDRGGQGHEGGDPDRRRLRRG